MMSPLEVKRPEAVTGAAIGHKTHGRPAVHSCQDCVTEREEFGVDDGEHGLAAAVAVTQGELQQVQQALWEAYWRQTVEVCWTLVVEALQGPHGELLEGDHVIVSEPTTFTSGDSPTRASLNASPRISLNTPSNPWEDTPHPLQPITLLYK